MKKSMFLLLAVVAVFCLAASCGGGGDDDEDELYNFSGSWPASLVVTASNVPGIPVGDGGGDVLVITQNGTAITATWQSIANLLTMNGTCDPVAKTFSAQGLDATGITHMINGAGVDSDSMSGAFSMSKGGLTASGTWTGDLASRAAAAGAGGAVSGLTAAFAK